MSITKCSMCFPPPPGTFVSTLTTISSLLLATLPGKTEMVSNWEWSSLNRQLPFYRTFHMHNENCGSRHCTTKKATSTKCNSHSCFPDLDSACGNWAGYQPMTLKENRKGGVSSTCYKSNISSNWHQNEAILMVTPAECLFLHFFTEEGKQMTC